MSSFAKLFSFSLGCMLLRSGSEKLLSTAGLVDSLGLSAESDKALRRAFTFSRNSRLFFLSSCKCVGSLNSISFSHSYLPYDWGNSKETVLDFFSCQASLWKRFVFLRSWVMFHLLPIVLTNWMFGLWLRVLSDCYCWIGQVIKTNYMVN